MSDAFPIAMMDSTLDWKLTASLPKNPKGQKLFDLRINDRDFLDLDFMMVDEYHLKTLRGEIILNDIPFLDKDSRFDWNSQLAENRIVTKHGEVPLITSIVLKNMQGS